jgi:hypothetical protein
MKMKAKSLKWFEDRIGKKVVRKTKVCDCNSCTEANESGFVVRDMLHAKYLHDCQMEVGLHYAEKQ